MIITWVIVVINANLFDVRHKHMDDYIIYAEDVLKFATNVALDLWSFYIFIVGQISL